MQPVLRARKREMAGEPARDIAPQRVELRRRNIARARQIDADHGGRDRARQQTRKDRLGDDGQERP
jgi:hypothetical protein